MVATFGRTAAAQKQESRRLVCGVEQLGIRDWDGPRTTRVTSTPGRAVVLPGFLSFPPDPQLVLNVRLLPGCLPCVFRHVGPGLHVEQVHLTRDDPSI